MQTSMKFIVTKGQKLNDLKCEFIRKGIGIYKLGQISHEALAFAVLADRYSMFTAEDATNHVPNPWDFEELQSMNNGLPIVIKLYVTKIDDTTTSWEFERMSHFRSKVVDEVWKDIHRLFSEKFPDLNANAVQLV